MPMEVYNHWDGTHTHTTTEGGNPKKICGVDVKSGARETLAEHARGLGQPGSYFNTGDKPETNHNPGNKVLCPNCRGETFKENHGCWGDNSY